MYLFSLLHVSFVTNVTFCAQKHRVEARRDGAVGKREGRFLHAWLHFFAVLLFGFEVIIVYLHYNRYIFAS